MTTPDEEEPQPWSLGCVIGCLAYFVLVSWGTICVVKHFFFGA